MNSKEQILTMLGEEFARWEALLSSLDGSRLTAPLLPSDWSIKDVLAHLHAWQQRSIARLEAALEGREPEFPAWPAALDPEPDGQPHNANAWLYESYRDQPWSQVYRQWREGFLHFLALGAAVPEEALLEAGRYEWMEGQPLSLVLTASYDHHHQEHLGPLLIWLWENEILTFAS